jgi:tetratricopeptide (TPR) repeat protein
MQTPDQGPQIDPNDPVALAQQAVRLDDAYRRSGRIELAEQAAEYFRASVAAATADCPERALFLSAAALCLQELFDRTGRAELLDEVERLGREALAKTLVNDRFHAQRLTILGNVLMARYECTGRMDALVEAVQIYRSAVDLSPEDPVDRAAGLSNLGNGLRQLFARTGDVAILSEAVERGREAIAATPASHPDRARWQTNLAITLRTVFERTGEVAVIGEAVETARAAVEATSGDHGDRAFRLSILATALYRWSEYTGDVQVLTEALDAGRAAVAAVPTGHPRRASILSELGSIARLLFKYTGRTEALVEAVQVGRAAVDALPVGHPDRLDHLSNLGTALREAYERTGDQELLAEAVKTGRDAVEATPADHPLHVARVTNLVATLQREFESTGRAAALLEAVEAARTAAEAMPDDLADRGTVLGNLGNVLRATYERTGLEAVLGEAARMLRDALEATPAGHAGRPARLNDLAIAVVLLAEHTGKKEGFAAAYTFLKEAEQAVPEGHPDRLTILGNRAAAALKIFEFDRRPEIGEVAVAALRAVALNTPETDPERATRLRNLGLALQILAAEREAGVQLLEEARECFRAAANFASAATLVRIRAGREQARLELATAQAPAAALEAIERVVELIERAAPASLVRVDREHRVALLDGLPAQAAAVALAAGRPERAVELLERTRGVLVAETLGLRDGALDRLRVEHPELARKLDEARRALAELDQSPTAASIAGRETPSSPGSAQRVAERRTEALTAIEETLTQVRALPGFDDFLRPSLAGLTPRTQAGPVVLVNCDLARCDALILTGDATEPVRHVPLPGLTHDTVLEYGERLLNAGCATARRDLSPPERANTEQAISHVLGWLWDVVAEPVLTALGYHATPGESTGEEPDGGAAWPRIWWCPVGVAAALPLHAAGHHDDPADCPGGRRTVLDRVVSSYTPTLLALRAASSGAATVPTGDAGEAPIAPAVIITVPDIPGAELRGAEREAGTLGPLLPGALVLSSPTRAQVLEALPQYRIAHFACHGLADRERPGQSQLLLADHAIAPLTVADVVRLDLSADLAYLSACRTGVTAPQLADEALHLTGAFHLAGYRQVIGTLWPVDDLAAADLAVDVYSRLTNNASTQPDTKRAAEALHHAVRTLRDRQPATPTLWAPYTHTGA